MSAMDNKELVRTYFERAFVRNDLDQAAELIDENYCLHDPTRPGFRGGVAAFKEAQRVYLEAIRGHSLTIDDQIAEGDRVVTRWTATGCQSKDLPGIPNKGGCFKIGGITISRVSGGKIVEEWQDWDSPGLARQLGSV
ncbi:MAG: ester cyclase [Desulfomonile tiedjei]|nr:ester cyclase [Desulfomonile tiedjei]